MSSYMWGLGILMVWSGVVTGFCPRAPLQPYRGCHRGERLKDGTGSEPEMIPNSDHRLRRFPFSKMYYEDYLRRLNSHNRTVSDAAILQDPGFSDEEEAEEIGVVKIPRAAGGGGFRIIIQPGGLGMFQEGVEDDDDEEAGTDPLGIPSPSPSHYSRGRAESYAEYKRRGSQKSENFQVITNATTRFSDVGGYHNVKHEMMQCVDLLQNYTKYAKFNVRVPKGLILEGPPGNGKTLLAKAFAGEAGVGFIAVSGAQFQEKYVGVGSTRMRELFKLAHDNRPCVIFIDEIDAMGRKRSGDGESSSSERDSTLNELLVQMDGFTSAEGIFVMAASNRADLLDPALMRPGRIDKRIFIGPPDAATREEILNIHLAGKPRDMVNMTVDHLVDITASLSCAQIENLLNEAMLSALRDNRYMMNLTDVNMVMNRMMVGWQPNEHQFSSDIIDHIAIHEMGHVVMGLMSKHHAKVSKVTINLYSPQSPGYTVFQPSASTIYTREALFEHLMILLSGRIAEEVFFNVTVTTGAINDFEEALKLAEKMVVYYGMGKHAIYPSNSDKYKEMIDDEVWALLNDAYSYANFVVRRCRHFIGETAERLKRDRLLQAADLWALLETEPYRELLDLAYCDNPHPPPQAP